MLPPQLRTTLFPYTTLFRSALFQYKAQTAAEVRGLVLTGDWPQSFPTSESDRKSTRLNSSHLGISYAVFCLKKKKPKLQFSSLQTSSICMLLQFLLSAITLH